MLKLNATKIERRDTTKSRSSLPHDFGEIPRGFFANKLGSHAFFRHAFIATLFRLALNDRNCRSVGWLVGWLVGLSVPPHLYLKN